MNEGVEQVGFRTTRASVEQSAAVVPGIRFVGAYTKTVIEPTEVKITFYWKDSDDRRAAGWDTGSIVVSGWKIKKDGTPGQVRADQYAGSRTEWPAWVVAMVEAHRPHWTPTPGTRWASNA
jgi:hypothetical protein